MPKIDAESVDLIYLDPPFNSKATYNLLYRSPDGEAAQAQYKAFVDSWRWDTPADAALARIMTSGSPAAGIIASLHNHMQKSDLMAYLVMMTVRLIELHRTLKDSGSLYLHCDSSASHYLKIILDSIFGPQSFRNEIIWKRSSAHNDSKQGARHFGRITDTILFYTKSRQAIWNTLHTKYNEDYASGMYKYVEEKTGRRYGLFDLTGPGGAAKGNPEFEVLGVTRHWRFSREKMKDMLVQGRVVQTRPGSVPRQKRYLDEMPGVQLQNLWDDLPVISNRSKEALGYQTQKPITLLERIISASSNPGDLVLDPFCGCGTAIEAAHQLGRRWIGIDITALAIDVVERRLSRRGLRQNIDYKIDGVPLDDDGANRLFENDPHQFQLWAITLVDGQPREGGKKGADKGIDGIIYYQDDARSIDQALISVKGGENIHATHVRDLIGAMNNMRARLGVLVTLHKPTSAMLAAAREAGSTEAGGKLRPRVQIRTIQELLSGNKPSMPPIHDIISAAASARRLRLPPLAPSAEDVRREPSFKYPIKGGRQRAIQEGLPIDEPLLVSPRPSKDRSRKKSA
ncbi:DNA methyltransferase [Bradyrhizobium stylosanthis]|nr:DNA methyltransferase [Bradyrhizobium stylosanthis]